MTDSSPLFAPTPERSTCQNKWNYQEDQAETKLLLICECLYSIFSHPFIIFLALTIFLNGFFPLTTLICTQSKETKIILIYSFLPHLSATHPLPNYSQFFSLFIISFFFVLQTRNGTWSFGLLVYYYEYYYYYYLVVFFNFFLPSFWSCSQPVLTPRVICFMSSIYNYTDVSTLFHLFPPTTTTTRPHQQFIHFSLLPSEKKKQIKLMRISGRKRTTFFDLLIFHLTILPHHLISPSSFDFVN